MRGDILGWGIDFFVQIVIRPWWLRPPNDFFRICSFGYNVCLYHLKEKYLTFREALEVICFCLRYKIIFLTAKLQEKKEFDKG